MFRVFFVLIISLQLSACAQLSRSPKVKPMLYGVAGGSALALATQDQQENKSLHLLNGAALGGLLTWAYLTATAGPANSQVTKEIEDIQKNISFIEQVQQQDQGLKSKSLKKTSIKKWETEKIDQNGKELIYIESTYEKNNEE